MRVNRKREEKKEVKRKNGRVNRVRKRGNEGKQ